MEIRGEKVILSKISIKDLDFICMIESDGNLWCFEESVQSDKQAIREKYLKKINEGDRTKSFDFIVSLATENEKTPIGIAQIWSYINYRKSWEIGFAVLPEYSGYGYGSEAAQLLLDFAFKKLNAHKVVGMCNSKNTRSAALMQHIGMSKEGVFKEELFWNNQWTDQYYFSILETEFLKVED